MDLKGRWWLSIMAQGPTTAPGTVALSVILLQLVFAEMAAAKTLWWTAVNRKYEKTQRAILEVFNEILYTLSNILVLISFCSLCCGLWLTLCSWKLTAPHLQLMIWILHWTFDWSCTDHVAIMHWSRDCACTDDVAVRALITCLSGSDQWLTGADQGTVHALIRWLIMHWSCGYHALIT